MNVVLINECNAMRYVKCIIITMDSGESNIQILKIMMI